MDAVWPLCYDEKMSDYDIAERGYNAFVDAWIEEDLPHPDLMDIAQIERMAPRTPGVAREMLHAYVALRRPFIKSVELLAVERPFAVPLFVDNPDIAYVGRLDKEIKKDGRIIVPEHKTTTSYKKDGPFRSDWLDQWSPNTQVEGYLYAGHMRHGDKMKAVWIDGALVHKQVHDGFQFIPVMRKFEMIEGWLSDVQYWISRIMDQQSKLEGDIQSPPYMEVFPKNTDACNDYNTRCPYLELCRFVPNPARMDDPPEGFKVEKWEPYNELELDRIGLKPEE